VSVDGFTSGGEPRTDGAVGGADGGNGTEAARDGVDGAADGNALYPQGDASTTDPTAGLAHFCATVGGSHQHCWDFDGTDPFTGWTPPFASGGGAFGIDANIFQSPPRAFSVGYVGGDSAAGLTQSVTGISQSLVLEASIRPSPDTTDIRMIGIQLAGSEWLHLNRIGGKLLLDDANPLPDAGSVARQSATLDFPASTWSRVRIEMVPSKATLTIGAAAMSVPLSTWADNAFLGLGIAFIGSGTGSLDYDNVTLDVH
jgi:hypothetical protein